MPPPQVELTLVVAATRTMGIGAKGTLPWTGLKKEMAYFARVSKRLPPQVALTPSLSLSLTPPSRVSVSVVIDCFFFFISYK